MTRRLILIRHAKSSWGDPRLDDHSRPLNKRGRASAAAIGRWLARHNYLPDQVLCSSAVRTRETWIGIADKLIGTPDAEYLDALYGATPEQMLACLRRATGKTVMMFGHNPGTGETAQNLVIAPPSHVRFGHYPTAATTVIDFEIDSWSDVAWHSGKVVDFVAPRDLI